MLVVQISGKAQHGKDISAKLLKEELESLGNKVLIAHNADLLKYICKTFFDWDGKKDDKGRSILQYVGTDVIREQHPDFWIEFLLKILNLFNDVWDYIIIPDCRFPNEIKVPAERGFNCVHLRVKRTNFTSTLTAEQQLHSSETALDNTIPDMAVINSGDISDLKNRLKEIVPYLQDNFNRPKTPRSLDILVDIDDVSLKTLPKWIDWLNKKHKTNVDWQDLTEWDFSKHFPTLSESELYEPLGTPEFWAEVQPVDGVVETLTGLFFMGHRIKFITTATPYSAYLKITKALVKHFYFTSCDDVIVTSNKQMVSGDVLIDDGIHNLEGGKYAKILFTMPHNKDYDVNSNKMYRANNWREVYHIVKQLSETTK